MEATAKGRAVKLVMVTTENNNKFYEMEALEDDTFEVRYGRIGSQPTVRSYPIKKWDQKYREKVRKGYRDVSQLRATPADTNYKIDNPSVKRLVNTLTQLAHKYICSNYMVTVAEVTSQQVEEAQLLIDEISSLLKADASTSAINNSLIDLFTIIPRRMSRVSDHLIESLNSQESVTLAEKQLAAEQATLDVMAGQVKAKEQTADLTPSSSLLDALGLIIEPETDEEMIDKVKNKMGDRAHLYSRLYSVTNVHTQKAFDHFVSSESNKKTELLWHGSRNENWLSILESGLVLRPANAIITGKMFGYGLYFADKCQKSLNYTSLRGSCWTGGSDHRAFLGLYDVHVGKQLTYIRHDSSCYELDSKKLLRRRGLRKVQYNSVFAKGGVDLINNEYIVYQNAQCTVRYLVEISQA